MYVRPSGPLSIGGVVDDAIRLYRASFSRTWKVALGIGIVSAGLTIAMGLVSPASFDITHAFLAPRQASQVRTPPAFTLIYLVILLVHIFFYGAVFACQDAVARGTPLSAENAVMAGLRRLPGMVLATLVFGIAFMLGCIALLIPGIYLWGKLQLWPAALFAENATAMQSLGSSWNLTKGRWWRTVVIISVALIILYILTLAISLIPISLLAITGLKGGSIFLAQLAGVPFNLLSFVVIGPALPAILLAVHHDCKLRSEGADLLERAGALGHT